MSGQVYNKDLEIRDAFESYNFDILVGGRKLCRIEQENARIHDCYDIRMYDGAMEDIVVCDHVSDKADSTRYSD